MAPITNPYTRKNTPLLVVISGPSGAGKDAVINRIRALGYPFHFVITATNRPPRPGEVHGRDYFFVSTAEFEQMIAQDELLEYARVYGDYKGVPKSQIRKALASGQDVIMRVDVQGAQTVRKIVPQAVLIYLSAETETAQIERLRLRKTDSEEQVAIRLRTALAENETLPRFDYLVINGQNKLDEACQTIAAIVQAEKCRVNREEISL